MSAGRIYNVEEEEEVVVDDKLSYRIFSILESRFLFGYDDKELNHLWIPKPLFANSQMLDDGPSPPTSTSSVVSSNPTPPPPPTPPLPSTSNGKVCILSVDGGGGGKLSVLAAKALIYLEHTLKQKSGNSNATISDYFDITAGAGMGGILVSMLFSSSHCSSSSQRRPIYSADEACRLVDDIIEASSSNTNNENTSSTADADASASTVIPANGGNRNGTSTPNRSSIRKRLRLHMPRIPKPPLHLFQCLHAGHENRRSNRKGKTTIDLPVTSFDDGTGVAETTEEEEEKVDCLDRKLKEILGEDVSLRDTLKPVLIPCYDLRSSAPFLFSTTSSVESENYNFRMWEVCRATWVEPWRFKPKEMTSTDGITRCVGVDGGLTSMSNPTATAITHVLHNKKDFPFVRGFEDLLVLSLGTDGCPVLDERQDSWAKPIAVVASQVTADLVDNAVSMSFTHNNSSKNYVRLQANMFPSGWSTEDEEDVLRQKTMECCRGLWLGGAMKTVGDRNNMEMLDWFADELVLLNLQSSESEVWH